MILPQGAGSNAVRHEIAYSTGLFAN